jgi:hypothetical protein
MSSNPPPKGKLDWDEIQAKFPALVMLFTTVQEAIRDAQVDGKLTGEEYGNITAVAAPQLGRLYDQIAQDLKD